MVMRRMDCSVTPSVAMASVESDLCAGRTVLKASLTPGLTASSLPRTVAELATSACLSASATTPNVSNGAYSTTRSVLSTSTTSLAASAHQIALTVCSISGCHARSSPTDEVLVPP